MKILTSRCTISELKAKHIPVLSLRNTDPEVRAFLGGPITREVAKNGWLMEWPAP